VSTLVAPTWPIYASGVDEGDVLQRVDGQRMNDEADLTAVLQRHKAGDTIAIVFADRSGATKTAHVTLAEDPHVDVVSIDATLTAAQKTFRDRWLNSKTN
jgi:S1-C subfamily serine protease